MAGSGWLADDLEWHQSVLLDFDLLIEFAYLALMHEQLALASRLVVKVLARRAVWRDVHVFQPDLAVADHREAILERAAGRGQRGRVMWRRWQQRR